MKKNLIVFISIFIIISACGCGKGAERLPVKVLIVPHFEVGEMSGDDVGEAQMFFEEYLEGCDEYLVSDGTTLYYNPENKVAMFLTGYGKVNAAMSTTAVLSDSRFDYSNAYILAVGCCGGATGYATLGDVVLESAVCDYDLGHTADIRDMTETDNAKLWFASKDYDEYGCRKFDSDLIERAYACTKDISLKTTDISRDILAKNFPGEEWAMRNPRVVKGTSITSDDYWKGKYNHDKALQVTEYYECPDPYASSEMEDIAVANVASRFGLLDRTLILRVPVNVDEFLDGATPESYWSDNIKFSDEIADDGGDVLDIFEPGMENIFNVGKTIIDLMLNGDF